MRETLDRRRVRGRKGAVSRAEFDELFDRVSQVEGRALYQRRIVSVPGGGGGSAGSADDGYGVLLSGLGGLLFGASGEGVPEAPDEGEAFLYSRSDPEAAGLARLFAQDSDGVEFSLMGITRLGAVKLGGQASQIEFTSIPGNFKALMIFWTVRSTQASGATRLRMRVNDATSLYGWINLIHIGAGGTSQEGGFDESSWTIGSVTGSDMNNSMFGTGVCFIPGYASPSIRPGFISMGGRADGQSGIGDHQSRWGYGTRRTTSAITSIQLFTVDSLDAGSEVELYGVY